VSRLPPRNHTPFSAANYAIGITAVLPTNGAARAVSGVTARDMLRTTTLGELDGAALAALTPTIGTLARYEGLPCHAAAAEARGTQGATSIRTTEIGS
jgi:histidinol dehydrogenase